ncbi:MAG TPA: pilus assembly protein PilM [Solirubrobacteraceae bacterium]|jgi:type IV pilus assembly protein PilM|nr:pilus assembly protein PilM [Solirubrobacteraceae bacterium]
MRIDSHMQLLPSRIPSLPAKLSLSKLSLPLGRRSAQELVGLDIQPGFVAAVKAHVNGGILVERAAALPLPADTVRDGEVLDEGALGEALQELFSRGGLSKRVRVGVANQRTVLRTLELPPVTDPKELAAAVNFQAQEQVPMPLGNAVMDFHALGIIDTPAGPRQRAVLVAAQRDMVERLLAAVRRAGLQVEGIDLSAFALIRSLYRADPEQKGRVLYLNVDGLTNLAIAEGTVCRFTRVVGGGLEAMAAELAERRSIALAEARALLASVDLRTPPSQPAAPAIEDAPPAGSHDEPPAGEAGDTDVEAHGAGPEQQPPTPEQAEERERAMSYEELADLEGLALPSQPPSNADAWAVLENGIRDISGEVRNSLDFHRSQEGGGEVTHVVMSGAAEDIPGFAETLQASLGVEVRSGEVGLYTPELAESVSPHRLAVATGLAATEVPQ